MTIRTLLRGCSLGAYFTCLMLAVSAASLMLAGTLWEVLRVQVWDGQAVGNDDWLLLMLPIGALLGTWLAIRTRRSRRFQRLCVPVGVGVLGIGLFLAFTYFAAARTASEAMGMAGLGKLIVGVVFLAVAGIGVLFLGAALFGWLANGWRREAPATDRSPTPALPSART